MLIYTARIEGRTGEGGCASLGALKVTSRLLFIKVIWRGLVSEGESGHWRTSICMLGEVTRAVMTCMVAEIMGRGIIKWK